MEPVFGFSDLCVPFNPNQSKLVEILEDLVELGYKNVAIEQVYDESDLTKKEKGRKLTDVFPAPETLTFVERFKGRLKIYQRLTISYSDQSISHAMSHSLNLKKYHLIAGLPSTESSLQHCCSTFIGDIVTFSPDNVGVPFSRKYYELAVRRGLYFEVKYAPAIVSSTDRRFIIRKAHSYHMYGKSRNIILTSGATSKFHTRSPYDIMNLGLLFGLSEEQAKNSLVRMSRGAILKGESRRHGKTVMFVKDVPISSDDDEDDTEEEEDDDDDDDENDNENKEGNVDDNDDKSKKDSDTQMEVLSDEACHQPTKRLKTK